MQKRGYCKTLEILSYGTIIFSNFLSKKNAQFIFKFIFKLGTTNENFNDYAKLSFKCTYSEPNSKIICGKKLDNLNKIAHHICKEHPIDVSHVNSAFTTTTNNIEKIYLVSLLS